ncbi:coiled-coil domain-containing protein 166 [Plakobranchus ocellatus]|uniref:Coiled-coil domain-containing protein 166 n=1 Tax=Plakobranchus ocellatus TaxID=259542 RepID=A0AAV3YGW9_9GAST|nr:coiled-coil domain-containing protein 166 [Plakobranchus ocellatus]
MPPKKKGKKGKGGDDAPVEAEKPKTPEPTEKEVLLKEELEQVTLQLEKDKKTVDDLYPLQLIDIWKQENEWLQNEAQKIRIESHEYMSYMEKKTSKRQTTIITLSDHNKQEIRNIQLQRQNMEEEFDEKKKSLENLLLEKQHLLEKTNQELGDLQEYKDLQTDQLNKIRELERQVMQMRAHHTERIQQMKSDFLREKKDYQHDSDFRIQSLEKKANKEAVQCLTEHTNKIKLENRALRQELLNLIKTTRALNEHQRLLLEQKRQLLREQNYANDLKMLREARQKKSYKPLDLGQEEEDEGSATAGAENSLSLPQI